MFFINLGQPSALSCLLNAAPLTSQIGGAMDSNLQMKKLKIAQAKCTVFYRYNSLGNEKTMLPIPM